jgi:hypothetical protein
MEVDDVKRGDKMTRHKGPGVHLAIFMCPETRQVPKCSICYALSYATEMKKLMEKKCIFGNLEVISAFLGKRESCTFCARSHKSRQCFSRRLKLSVCIAYQCVWVIFKIHFDKSIQLVAVIEQSQH